MERRSTIPLVTPVELQNRTGNLGPGSSHRISVRHGRDCRRSRTTESCQLPSPLWSHPFHTDMDRTMSLDWVIEFHLVRVLLR